MDNRLLYDLCARLDSLLREPGWVRATLYRRLPADSLTVTVGAG
jgi:hypothetical protein